MGEPEPGLEPPSDDPFLSVLLVTVIIIQSAGWLASDQLLLARLEVSLSVNLPVFLQEAYLKTRQGQILISIWNLLMTKLDTFPPPLITPSPFIESSKNV
jgi:hypothetical protein